MLFLLLWLSQVYNWGYKSKTHKHYNYLQMIIKIESIYKSNENVKLRGSGLETKWSN
jgi:hypothetical protein